MDTNQNLAGKGVRSPLDAIWTIHVLIIIWYLLFFDIIFLCCSLVKTHSQF